MVCIILCPESVLEMGRSSDVQSYMYYLYLKFVDICTL